MSPSESSAWLTCVTIDPGEARVTRDEVIARLEEHRVESRPVRRPLTMQPICPGVRPIGHRWRPACSCRASRRRRTGTWTMRRPRIS